MTDQFPAPHETETETTPPRPIPVSDADTPAPSDSAPTASAEDASSEGPTRVEKLQVAGKDLADKTKELMAEGNVRRIILKTHKGKTLLEIPLGAGVVGVTVGAIFAPWAVAIAAIAALVGSVSVIVERREPPNTPQE